ncbi:glucosaminidase domain-containing protein [Arenibaculum pallidiluteum]|uniref:glucosaminidase domain-containing protein n=1 Tax=Arenibaculum pallidiluteum TaxID=2812559 RepID=UPI001A97C133|nr:glucosaminidase domain-containing protein [Arenibaculum pallidiluteum]
MNWPRLLTAGVCTFVLGAAAGVLVNGGGPGRPPGAGAPLVVIALDGAAGRADVPASAGRARQDGTLPQGSVVIAIAPPRPLLDERPGERPGERPDGHPAATLLAQAPSLPTPAEPAPATPDPVPGMPVAPVGAPPALPARPEDGDGADGLRLALLPGATGACAADLAAAAELVLMARHEPVPPLMPIPLPERSPPPRTPDPVRIALDPRAIGVSSSAEARAAALTALAVSDDAPPLMPLPLPEPMLLSRLADTKPAPEPLAIAGGDPAGILPALHAAEPPAVPMALAGAAPAGILPPLAAAEPVPLPLAVAGGPGLGLDPLAPDAIDPVPLAPAGTAPPAGLAPLVASGPMPEPLSPAIRPRDAMLPLLAQVGPAPEPLAPALPSRDAVLPLLAQADPAPEPLAIAGRSTPAGDSAVPPQDEAPAPPEAPVVAVGAASDPPTLAAAAVAPDRPEVEAPAALSAPDDAGAATDPGGAMAGARAQDAAPRLAEAILPPIGAEIAPEPMALAGSDPGFILPPLPTSPAIPESPAVFATPPAAVANALPRTGPIEPLALAGSPVPELPLALAPELDEAPLALAAGQGPTLRLGMLAGPEHEPAPLALAGSPGPGLGTLARSEPDPAPLALAGSPEPGLGTLARSELDAAPLAFAGSPAIAPAMGIALAEPVTEGPLAPRGGPGAVAWGPVGTSQAEGTRLGPGRTGLDLAATDPAAVEPIAPAVPAAPVLALASTGLSDGAELARVQASAFRADGFRGTDPADAPLLLAADPCAGPGLVHPAPAGTGAPDVARPAEALVAAAPVLPRPPALPAAKHPEAKHPETRHPGAKHPEARRELARAMPVPRPPQGGSAAPQRQAPAPPEPAPGIGNVERLAALLESHAFSLGGVRDHGKPVPRVFLAALPSDMHGIRSAEDRKELFIGAVLPWILHINEEIQSDRERLKTLAARQGEGKPAAPADLAWLETLAARYEVPEAMQGGVPDYRALLRRVDVVPPSLALSQAAEESGWGTSRVARMSNALFGQTAWRSGPRGRSVGEVRGFADIDDSVRSYIHNLNTHPAYEALRGARAALRAAGRHPDGHALAGGLLRYSERGRAYVTAVRTIMRGNDFVRLDRARLAPPALRDGAPQVAEAAQP